MHRGQTASHAFQAKLQQWGMVWSMSRKANCWDDAVAESFFNSLKIERVHGQRYLTRAQTQADLFEYIEMFYNRSRRHSAPGSSAIRHNWWHDHVLCLVSEESREPHFCWNSCDSNDTCLSIIER